MDFPVQVKVAHGPAALTLIDARGYTVGCMDYVPGYPRKMIVYADHTRASPIYTLETERVDDLSAEYRLAAPKGGHLGSVKRSGKRSIWRAHYAIHVGTEPTFEVLEENPFVKVLDFVVGAIPLIGAFTGTFLNPTYRVARPDGTPALRLIKQPSFNDGLLFAIEKTGELTDAEREVALLALVVVICRERTRG